MITPTKLQVLIGKRRYLTLEYEQVKAENEQFQKEFVEYMKNMEQTQQTTILQPEQEKIKKNKKSSKTDPLIKILYRDIMKHTHPDKVGDDPKMKKIHQQASDHKNDNNVIGILDICDQLEIKIPNLDKKYYTMIDEEIDEIQQQIDKIKKSDSYTWGVADEETKKKYKQAILDKLK